MKPTPLTEGDYLLTLRGQSEVVRVMETYLCESPRKETTLKAHWLTGRPRFPYLVSELIEWGATFEAIR